MDLVRLRGFEWVAGLWILVTACGVDGVRIGSSRNPSGADAAPSRTAESNCPAPVAHWELDENGGTAALDRTSSVNATVQGTVTLSSATGIVDGAADFDGGGAINVGFTDNLPAMDFTWAAWVRPDDLRNRVLFLIGESSDGSASYLKWADEMDAEFVLNDRIVINAAAGFAADSTWQHVAVTRMDGTVTLHRDGTIVATRGTMHRCASPGVF